MGLCRTKFVALGASDVPKAFSVCLSSKNTFSISELFGFLREMVILFHVLHRNVLKVKSATKVFYFQFNFQSFSPRFINNFNGLKNFSGTSMQVQQWYTVCIERRAENCFTKITPQKHIIYNAFYPVRICQLDLWTSLFSLATWMFTILFFGFPTSLLITSTINVFNLLWKVITQVILCHRQYIWWKIYINRIHSWIRAHYAE